MLSCIKILLITNAEYEKKFKAILLHITLSHLQYSWNCNVSRTAGFSNRSVCKEVMSSVTETNTSMFFKTKKRPSHLRTKSYGSYILS